MPAPPPPGPLTLDLEYRGETAWRWVLADAAGRFLADHAVALDPADPHYRGFVDLPAYLDYLRPARAPEALLAELGDWIGARVFGAVGAALLGVRPNPVCVVRVRVPAAAQALLFRPFELARLGGQTLAERGIRLIYTAAGAAPDAAAPAEVAEAPEGALRMLAVFSLPDHATPLSLRQERVGLERLVETFVATRGRAVELRVLQYGTTRDELAEVLEEYPGWDVLHFSGHGLAGELVLEGPDGAPDPVGADELIERLEVTQGRLRLVTLSACYSGAADTAGARAALGLDADPARGAPGGAPAVARHLAAAPAGQAPDAGAPDAETPNGYSPNAGGGAAAASGLATTALPSLGQRLAEALDCAVVAMRYPVLDRFAADLALELYDRLLVKGRPLPAALQLALDDVLGATDAASPVPEPGLARGTPLLFGPRAATLRLVAPNGPPPDRGLAEVGLFEFPPPPEHFVGRLGPMLRARQALAPASGRTAVVFYGMAGAGKTACALELAHRYAPQYTARFRGFAWYKAPEEGADVGGALAAFAAALEGQLPGLALVGLVDDPATFRQRALPRLRAWMQSHAYLLVLDNVEGLLTDDGRWRDARWGELLAALTEHAGLGRVVLTSRRMPATLADAPRVQREAIHALSLAESVVLARQLPHLGPLFAASAGAAGRAALRSLLGAAEGHPKLLELADGLAADPARLAAHLAPGDAAAPNGMAPNEAAPNASPGGGPGGEASRFFATGESARGADAFVRTLHAWTAAAAAALPPTARLFAAALARLEDDDRAQPVVDDNWKDILERLTGARGGAPAPEPARAWAEAALTEAGLGLDAALPALARAAIAEVTTTTTEALPLGPADLPALLPLVAQQDADVARALADGLAGDAGGDPDAVLSRVGANIQAALTRPAPALAAWLAVRVRPVSRWRARVHPGVAEALRGAAPAGVLTAVDWELGDYWVTVLRHGLQGEAAGRGPMIVASARRAVAYLVRAERWQYVSSAVGQLLFRDKLPSTLAFALPVLRQVAERARGTERELYEAGTLAAALVDAGQFAEAEAIQRDVTARAVARGDYLSASKVATDRLNLLFRQSRYEEALAVTDEMADYTRRAGLGPWTQLGDAYQRLQALNALGRSGEVLAELEQIRPRLAALPDQSDALELAAPDRVRECLFDAGHSAAMQSEQWAAALAFNAEVFASKRRRGAAMLDLARTRFNDYSALLRLGRLGECRALLAASREAFEEVGALPELGAVYTALGNVENQEGQFARAADFERAALRYSYQVGWPEECAASHNNYAIYVESAGHVGSAGEAPTAVLAHRLAAALIRVQSGAGSLSATIRALAASAPTARPAFVEVVQEVERVDGVRFGALFGGLPARHASGDAALEVVWALAGAERERADGPTAALARVRAAAEAGDAEAFAAAFQALPPELRAAATAAMTAAAREADSARADAAAREAVTRFAPLLARVADAARGDPAARAEIEAALPQLEANGWHLAGPVLRLWAGERDADALAAGLDAQDAALVRRTLELLA